MSLDDHRRRKRAADSTTKAATHRHIKREFWRGQNPRRQRKLQHGLQPGAELITTTRWLPVFAIAPPLASIQMTLWTGNS